MTAGVIREYRERGFGPLLIFEQIAMARRFGFTELECSWILEDNAQANGSAEAIGGTMYKTYRLYEKALADSR